MNDTAITPVSPKTPRRFTNWFRRSRTIRDAPTYKEGLVFGALCIGLVFLIWWILTRGEGKDRIVDVYSLASPEDTFASFPSLWFERELSLSAVISLARVLGGFLLSAAVAVPLGIIAGSYLRVNAFFRPLTVFGRSVPVAALIPLAMMWFGLGEFNKVMFIFIATVAFVLFDSTNAAQNVADRYIDTAYTLGAQRSPKKGARFAAIAGLVYGILLVTGWHVLLEDDVRPEFLSAMGTSGFWLRFVGGFAAGFLLWFPIAGHQVMRKVILPMAMPEIVNSLRLTFGLAFGYIMLVEVVNAKSGIGALINNSQRQGPREHVYLCLFIISLLAWSIDRGIMALQRHLFPHLKNAQA
jgi:ABC-type nitrate/sulfonate/bicarbonate transport system permease component